MLRLILIFVITPAVELAVLVKLGDAIGFWPTMATIVATGLVGSWLARSQGLSAWRRFQQRLAGGELPGQEAVDGVIILVSGALLITPGIITDLVGFIGLLPWTRGPLRNFVLRRFRTKVGVGTGASFGGRAGTNSPRRGEAEASEWRGSARPHPSHGAGAAADAGSR